MPRMGANYLSLSVALPGGTLGKRGKYEDRARREATGIFTRDAPRLESRVVGRGVNEDCSPEWESEGRCF